MENKLNKVKELLNAAIKESIIAGRNTSIAVYANFVKGKKLEGAIEALEKVIKILEE